MECIIKNLHDSFDIFGFSKDESKIFNIDETIPVHETFILEKSDEKDGKEEYEPSSFENENILYFNDNLELDDLFIF